MNRPTEYNLLARIAKASERVDLIVTIDERGGGDWTAWINDDYFCSDGMEDSQFRSFAFELMRQIEETGRAHFCRTWESGVANWWSYLAVSRMRLPPARQQSSSEEHLAMLECIAKTLEALPEVTP